MKQKNMTYTEDNIKIKKSLKMLSFTFQKNKILKRFVELFLFVGALLIFIYAEKTIFASKILPNNSIAFFFDFKHELLAQSNLLVLIRFLFLAILFFYPLIKTYLDLSFNKQKIKKYLPWFILYISASIASFVLFFAFEKYTLNILYLSFSLIALYLVDGSYAIYVHFVNKKLNPEQNKNIRWTLISLISRFLLVVFVIVSMLAWRFSANSKQTFYLLVENNSFYSFITDAFTIRSIQNLFIVVAFILFISFSLLFSFINVFWTLFNSKQAYILLKNNLTLIFWLFVALNFWIITTFSKIKTPSSYVDSSAITPNYLYLLLLIIPAALFIFYLVITFTKKMNTNSNLINSVYFWVLQISFWTIYWLETFLIENKLITNIILFATLILLIITFAINHFKNSHNSTKNNLIINYGYFVLINIIIFINVINVIMQSYNNNNFNYISANMALDEIFTLILLAFSILVLILKSIKFWIEFGKIAKYSPKNMEVSHEIKNK
ncbi:hypothetical protein KQ875_01545 [Mycoplasma zalophi]|uniref:Beta-carotene 15,15'-monooxygenase n=1 Tax=Mycoplasma zalophi TaxID=191287 RepID=A0ABS6DPZ8_9MOLU|nr:hypothetical protein [Mycoplasma zalophi]MBU4692279.1 hypothetical protein [Mycoplasma zalophi]